MASDSAEFFAGYDPVSGWGLFASVIEFLCPGSSSKPCRVMHDRFGIEETAESQELCRLTTMKFSLLALATSLTQARLFERCLLTKTPAPPGGFTSTPSPPPPEDAPSPPGDASPPPPPAPTPPSSPGRYDLIVDTTDVSSSLRSAFIRAAARWESIIRGDLDDVDTNGLSSSCPRLPTVIDDVYMCASTPSIDGRGGILGRAGAEYIRTNNNLPLTGIMEFDVADAGGSSFGDTILHEMGHVVRMK